MLTTLLLLLLAAPAETRLRDDLTVRPLRDGFWLHDSSNAEGIGANGLLAPLADGSVLLVDTPWTDAQTESLLAWATERLGPVKDAVITHSHADRMGGLSALRRRGIRAMALDLTAEKARAEGFPVPDVSLRARERLYRDPRGFELFYPGPGHTLDNIVVAFPAAGVLHGGCLLKSADATGQGYVAESFLPDWPRSVEAVRERYGKATIVVPGHGKVSGPGALARTIEIAQRALSGERRSGGHVHADVPEQVDAGPRWVFYVHGKILELQGREAKSPDFGRYEYDAILEALAGRGFEVVAEVRSADAGDAWVSRLVGQVRRLREKGVPAERIAVIGASRGGFLTVQAAAELAHPGLSYVVLAGCGEATRRRGPELRGRVLSIFDRKDRFSPSCQPTFDAAPALTATGELTLDLGLDHGLLYRPLPAWLDPAERWIRGDSASPQEGLAR